MNLFISLHAELLKIKRTSAVNLAVIIAAFIPFFWFLQMATNPEIKDFLGENPWWKFFHTSAQLRNFLFMPIYLIILCTLLVQLEFRNNAWKQVFATPQTYINIFLSKFLVIQLIIVLFFVAFNVFMFSAAFLFDLFHPDSLFEFETINLAEIFERDSTTFFTLFGVSAIQYWLSLSFRNFMAPVLIGVMMHIAAQLMFFKFDIVAMQYNPYILSTLVLTKDYAPNAMLYSYVSMGYGMIFLGIAFLKFRARNVIC